MHVFYLLAAVILGAMVSMQPPVNAQIAAILGSPILAATCSLVISLVVILAGRLVLDHASIGWPHLGALPWWALIGGVVGALFVVGSLVLAPNVGVAAFFVFVVLGQLTGAALIDHLGAFGAPPVPITWPRLLGIFLVFAGAALTQLRI